MNHEQALQRIQSLIDPNTTPDGDLVSDGELLDEIYLITQEALKVKRYQMFNHNNTLLGEFPTFTEAVAEGKFYKDQTGNPVFIEEMTNE